MFFTMPLRRVDFCHQMVGFSLIRLLSRFYGTFCMNFINVQYLSPGHLGGKAYTCVYMCVCFKELERNLELSTNSFQRQLAAEKKKTVSAQEEIQTLQEELERMTNKLKVSIV